MKAKNSYIFIPKDNNIKAKNVIVLKKIIPSIIINYFNVDQDEILIEEIKNHSKRFSKEIINKYNKVFRGFFIYNLADSSIKVEYKIIEADGTYYLDIMLDTKKDNIISCLEELNRIFISEKKFNIDYITILSYDFVSEYYCNVLFPRLNKFERKFRKLLFEIFTSQFKDLYFEETASEEIKRKAKENIKRKKGINIDIYRIQNYFYSLDMGSLREFLFNKTWTSIEEKNRNILLNKDFSKTSELDIKHMIEKLRPMSNWERFFKDKGFSNDVESIMKTINELRNLVAHNKIISKNDYDILKENLDKMTKNIDIALKKTEYKDFELINKIKYYELIRHFKEMMNSISNQISIFKY